MRGAIEYVTRDGSRLTPWMKFVIDRANREFKAKFGCELVVISGIRTYEEQRRIFLLRYVRHGDIRGRKVYDTRWWNGYLWYRIDPVGTVRQPGLSNHEIQGSKAAVDLRDTGKDAGVRTGGNPRADWLRANARRLGLIPSGYSFGEPWHYDIPDIFNNVPATAGGSDDDMPLTNEDLDKIATRVWGHMIQPQDENGNYVIGEFPARGFLSSAAAQAQAAKVAAEQAAPRVWAHRVQAQDGNGNLLKHPDGTPVTFPARGYLASTNAQVGGTVVDVDEAALAKALAPLLISNLPALSDEDVKRVAEAAADVLADRLRTK